MVVDAQGAWPLPWLAAPVQQALDSSRGHALLLHAAAGSGALAFGLTLAQAWLCEGSEPVTATSPQNARPCGRCGSCRLVQSHLHPDLFVLLPEVQRRAQGWPLADDKDAEGKAKPSRQIRIDEVRALIDWSTKTSARGRGKVALLHPAESLNLQSANALLKTLEEPPIGTRLLLSASDPASLLPTVRSRCQRLHLPEPPAEMATAWLAQEGQLQPADAQLLLAACSGRPLDALALLRDGVDAATWSGLPAAVARGQASVLAGWPLPRALDALQKLCHDALSIHSGGAARYFPQTRPASAQATPHAAAATRMRLLADWSRELARVARHDEHPWHEGLLLEALVKAGAHALTAPPGDGQESGVSGAQPRAVAARGLATLRP